MKLDISRMLNISLFLAMLFMPFTALRIGKVGPSEFFIIVSFVLTVISTVKGGSINAKHQPITVLYFLFVVATLLGLLYNHTIPEIPSGTVSSATFNLVSYFGVLIFIFTIERATSTGRIDLSKLLYRTVIGVTAIMSALYFLSLVTLTLGPFTLSSSGGRFMPLVTNVHHTAHVVAIFPFIALSMMELQKSLNYKSKSILFSCAVFLTFLAFETSTGKATFGASLGWVIYIGYKLHTLYIRRMSLTFTLAVVILLSVVLILDFDIWHLLVSIFEEEDHGGARASLYSQAYNVFQSSPFLGLGPSSHVFLLDSYYDVHNTILTAAIQGGFLGVIFISLILVLSFKKSLHSSALLGLFIVVLLYFVGGEALRRAPLWLAILCIFYLSDLKKRNRSERQL